MRRDGEAVVVLTPAVKVNPYSQESVEDWTAPPTEAVVENVAVAPGTSVEPAAVGREQVVSDLILYCPAGTAVTARNRVRVRGLDYKVDGEPQDWRRGVVVAVSRAEG